MAAEAQRQEQFQLQREGESKEDAAQHARDNTATIVHRGETDGGYVRADVPLDQLAEDKTHVSDERMKRLAQVRKQIGGQPKDPIFITDQPVIVEGQKKLTPLNGNNRIAHARENGDPTVPAFVTRKAWEAMNGAAAPEAVNRPTTTGAPPPAAPSEVPKREQAQPNTGREVSIAVPGESTSYPARYAIKDADEIAASHNAFSFEPNPRYAHRNDRDYRSTGNAARVTEQAQKFNPEFLTAESPTAEHGAPIIDQRGNVLGGNSRAMTLARVYQFEPQAAEAYKAALRQKAASYGLNPADVDRYERPVLVRELTGPVDAQRAITDFNKAGAAALSPAERAVADGKRLSPATVESIASRLENVGEDSTLAQAMRGDGGAELVNRLVQDGVVTPQERNGLVDERGQLTPEAKDRIAKMLVGRLFDSPAEFNATPPELRNKLERVAPQVLRVEGRPEWNITPVVREAVSALADARGHGIKNLDDLARQQSLGGGTRNYSPDAIAVARVLNNGPLRAAQVFRQFANDEALSRDGSQGTFLEPPTRSEAFQAAFEEGIHPSAIPRMQQGREAPYITGAGTRFHAAVAHLEPAALDPIEARYAQAYLANPSAMELALRVIAPGKLPPDHAALHWGAANIPAGELPGAIARLDAAIAQHGRLAGLRSLRDAAAQAARANRTLILVTDNAGIPDALRQVSFREEIHHAMQAEVSGGALRNHLGSSATAFVNSPHGRIAAQALRRDPSYAQISDGVMAAEIGVRLMDAGRYRELGLDQNQARELAELYRRTLEREHGHGATIQEIRDRLSAAGGPQIVPSSRGPGAIRPRNAAPARGGTDHAAEQAGLFDQATEDQSRVDAQRGADKLLGDQLTAQFKSGLAARPTRLKPAENRGLFDEDGPEQGNLLFPSVRSTLHGGIPLDVIGAIFKADMKEMLALKQKRDESLAALEKSKATPEDKKFGEKVIAYFTGERDVWAARVNQVMDRLRKLVPDPVEQEALSLMRDFKGKEQELTQFLQGTHPAFAELDKNNPLLKGTPGSDYAHAMAQIEKLRPVILKALNPTPRMLEADEALTRIAAGTLKEGQRLGFLDSRWTPEQYNPHILNRKGEGEFAEPIRDRWGKALGGKMGKYFGFAERREFPSLLHAVIEGYRPKTMNAFDAFTIHGDKFATARATHLLENQLADIGLGRYAAQGKAPRGWVRLAPHTTEFRKLVPYLREGPREGSAEAAEQVAQRKLAGMRAGKTYQQVSAEESARIESGEGGAVIPDVAELGLWVPEYIEKALRPITDPDYLGRIPLFKWMRHAQAYQKAVQLGLSFFHATTENYMALANMGPKGWIKGLRADRLDPEFEKAERDFIAHGGTTPVQGKTAEAIKGLQPGTIPSWGDIWRKAPVIREMDQLAQHITDFTFGKLQRQFKVTDYNLHQAAWMADHPNATTAELNAAKASMAKEINAVYGGLNTELLGVNRATTEMARALLLAPDWTFSNVFNVKYSLERGTQAGKLARAFWIRQLVGGAIATQLLSLALSQKLSSNPTQVYFGKDKDGQDVYQNVFFKGAAGDVINLVHNVYDYGAVEGLARTLSAKSAGFVRAGMQVLTNRDYLGHTIVSRDLNPIAGTVRGIAKTAESLAPIPFTVTNLKNMLIGPHADQYKTPEFLTVLFSGNPPRHIPPPGFKMTDEGLEEKDPEERDENSIWQQIRTGKRYQGVQP